VRFNLESGLEYMRRHFSHVETLEWHGAMPLPDVESALALWAGWAWGLTGEQDARAREEFGRLAAARIERDGDLQVRRHGGCFVGHA
jgi:hypothetical protein